MPLEVVARWDGARIGAGASVFHFDSEGGDFAAEGAAASVQRFFADIDAYLPGQVAVQVDPEAKLLSLNGDLLEFIPTGSPEVVVGGGSSPFLNGAGGCIRWLTNTVVGNRRLLGRTFIVPMVADAATGGDFKQTTLDAFNIACGRLLEGVATGSPDLVIWSRKNASQGVVTDGSLLRRPSSLRTRNDR